MDKTPTKKEGAKKMPRTREEKIDALKKRKQELENRLMALVSSKTKEERKIEDKKKFLIGACVLERIKRGDLKEAEMIAWMDDFLTRPYEREKFGLGEKKQ